MVEIRYGGDFEVADLAGKTVAEVREQYKPVFGIPNKARARLNDKDLKSKLEPERILSDEDKLSFARKSMKGLIMVGVFLLALAVAGSTFAYGALTQTITATVAPQSDFAALAVGADTPVWTSFGGFVGTIAAKDQVFKITPAAAFTGDFVVQLYISNVEEISEVYRALGLRFSIVCPVGNIALTDAVGTPAVGFLSLQNPFVEIEITTTGTPDGAEFCEVKLDGGFYKASQYGGGWTEFAEDPDIFAQVIQKGA